MAANDPMLMPQAQKPHCLIHIGSLKISLSSLLALWGNKKWAPSIKVENVENCQYIMG